MQQSTIQHIFLQNLTLKLKNNSIMKMLNIKHIYPYFPEHTKDIYNYKKTLGYRIETEGCELTSLGRKYYSMIVHKWNKEK